MQFDLHARPFAASFHPQCAVYALDNMVKQPRVERLGQRIAALLRSVRALLLYHLLSPSNDESAAESLTQRVCIQVEESPHRLITASPHRARKVTRLIVVKSNNLKLVKEYRKNAENKLLRDGGLEDVSQDGRTSHIFASLITHSFTNFGLSRENHAGGGGSGRARGEGGSEREGEGRGRKA